MLRLSSSWNAVSRYSFTPVHCYTFGDNTYQASTHGRWLCCVDL